MIDIDVGGSAELGLLTAAFPTRRSRVADWAAGNEFSMREIASWPRQDGPSRRYAGVSHIDCVKPPTRRQGHRRRPRRARIEISALGYYPNPLSPISTTAPT